MKKKSIFENFNFIVTKRISTWDYRAFEEAWCTPRLFLSNVRPDAPRLVKKLRITFWFVWGSIRDFVTKIHQKWKKVNFREFHLHHYKKEIHMGLQGSRRGMMQPQNVSFQCQTRCVTFGQKIQNSLFGMYEIL